MTLRDELVTLVDEVRDEVIDDEIGLRLHDVVVRRTTFAGDEPGRGDRTVVDVAITPRPKVLPPSTRAQMAAPGKFEAGDRVVSRISATYTVEQLAAVGAGDEVLWLIDGEPYRVVGEPEKRFLEWRVQLRRMRGRPGPTPLEEPPP